MDGSLTVETDRLDELSEFLSNYSKEILDSLKSLKNDMGKISSSWNDSAGSAFLQKYNSFIDESKQYATAINELSTFLKDISSKYDSNLFECLRNIGD